MNVIEHWGNPEALNWLVAVAAVLYAYVFYWFWKTQRIERVAELVAGVNPRRASMGFTIGASVVGLLQVGGLYIALEVFRNMGLKADWQLVAGVSTMLVGQALASMLLAMFGRWTGTESAAGNVMSAMLESRSARKQITRFALTFIALNLVVVAMMRPQGEGKQREVTREGVDIVFAVDLSKSMMADDIKPNRLEAAKQEINRVLDRLKGDRVGLVVFTAVAFQQSPLTSDYGAIRTYLDAIEPDMMPMGGTAVGRAVIRGIEQLTGESFLEQGLSSTPELAGPTSDHAKLIVVFTDGEDHETDPVRAAVEANKRGIRVYTVGLGSSTGARIPLYDEQGLPSGFMVRDNAPIETRLDETSLVSMAQAAGGDYYHYSGPGSVAKSLVDEINKLEKAELASLLIDTYEDYFVFPLIPAAILLFWQDFWGIDGEDQHPSQPANAGVAGGVPCGRPA